MKKHIFGIAVFILILVLCATAVSAKEEVVSVGIPVEEHPELFKARSMPTHGEAKIAVFLIEFPDHKNDNPLATREFYNKLYFEGGLNTQMGESVADFYNTQSYGKLMLGGEVFDWYTAKHERSYYDNRKAELIMEVGEYYRSSGVDFSKFDGNSDGVIDGIVYHFAGEYSTIRGDAWYSGVERSNRYGLGKIGDMRFTNMVQVYERAEERPNALIKIVCHELMHSFGMPDLYGEVWFGMEGISDLMSGNLALINPYTKMLLGWIDKVRVVTGDVKDIKLDLYGSASSDAVIVTDSYDSIFDEFYVVAYRGYNKKSDAVVWHVDARLSADGRSFMNTNLTFDPRPDKMNPHGKRDHSPYLFIEELSADPNYDFVFDVKLIGQDTVFKKDSVLGPDSLPSSDTHDGRYTGIRIYDFTEYNDAYMTFDVSFVKDTAPPFITTKDEDLEFKETVTVSFNEFIYAGAGFDKIKATDLSGKPIEISVMIPHHPRYTLEITFADKSYEGGYILIFPEGAVKDSSGNAMAAVTLTSSSRGFFFPSSDKELIGTGNFLRSNSKAFFFYDGDDLVVITGLWEKQVMDSRIEFMRLDGNGNMKLQKIVDNPFEGAVLKEGYKTGDGNYIFIMADQSDSTFDLLLCFDSKGNLKWKNDEYHNKDKYFREDQVLVKDNGIIILLQNERVSGKPYVPLNEFIFVDSASGRTVTYETGLDVTTLYKYRFYDLGNGMCLRADNSRLELVDADTYEVIAKAALSDLSADLKKISKAKANGDGTLMLYHYTDAKVEVILLDAALNKVKSVSFPRFNNYVPEFYWFGDDGFFYSQIMVAGNHENDQYHIYRYDRCLEKMWESDVVANFVYYFENASGELFAYRSMLVPKRECYVDFYGSEEKYENTHEHTLTHRDEVASACKSVGCIEHWYCDGCGCLFLADRQSLIADPKDMIIPIRDHTLEIISPAKAPTCETNGHTEKSKCTVCGVSFGSERIPALGGKHELSGWKITKEATCGGAGEQVNSCTKCTYKQTKEIPALVMHTYGEWTVVVEPTYEKEGSQTRTCSVCGNKEYKTVKPSDETEDTTAPVEPSDDKGGAPIAIFAAVAVLVFAGGAIAGVVTVRKKRSA